MFPSEFIGWICRFSLPGPRVYWEKVLRREGDVLHLYFIGERFEECPVCIFCNREPEFTMGDFVRFVSYLRQLFSVRVVKIHYPEMHQKHIMITEVEMDKAWLTFESPCEKLPCFEGVEWQAELVPEKK